MMDDISEADFHKEEEPASPAPPPSQHTDPASPTVAVTPEPVVRGEQATPSEIEYQVKWKLIINPMLYIMLDSHTPQNIS